MDVPSKPPEDMLSEKTAGGRPARRATGANTKPGGRIDIDPATTQSSQEIADQMAKYGITHQNRAGNEGVIAS
jgi:hypothetical protein